ncbi:MAG: NF038143 family protein [Desulfobacteraceae bacterium]|nr:NF038143 family protein [Desulfobacteraceae bacterium]
MEPSRKNTCEIIRQWERSNARSIAVAMVPPHQFSVWDFLIPIVFILNYMRTKERRELFIRNYLYTKIMALEGARDVELGEIDRQGAIERIRGKTDEALAAESRDIYSEDIREKQMEEIELLMDHYIKLLKAKGSDYAELVRQAYPEREDYRRFLDSLKKAEEAVVEAATRTMGDKVDPDAMATLRQETDRIRKNSIENLY